MQGWRNATWVCLIPVPVNAKRIGHNSTGTAQLITLRNKWSYQEADCEIAFAFFCYLNLKPEDLACTEHFIFVKWNSFSHALASPQWLLKGSLPTITSLVFCGVLFPCIYWTYYIVRRILSAWFKMRKYGSRRPDCTNTTIGGQSMGFGRVSCSSTKRGKEGKKSLFTKLCKILNQKVYTLNLFHHFCYQTHSSGCQPLLRGV